MTLTTLAQSGVEVVLTEATERLVERLCEEGVADPLAERLTLACVLADLFDLAGCHTPHEIEAAIAGE